MRGFLLMLPMLLCGQKKDKIHNVHINAMEKKIAGNQKIVATCFLVSSLPLANTQYIGNNRYLIPYNTNIVNLTGNVFLVVGSGFAIATVVYALLAKQKQNQYIEQKQSETDQKDVDASSNFLDKNEQIMEYLATASCLSLFMGFIFICVASGLYSYNM